MEASLKLYIRRSIQICPLSQNSVPCQKATWYHTSSLCLSYRHLTIADNANRRGRIIIFDHSIKLLRQCCRDNRVKPSVKWRTSHEKLNNQWLLITPHAKRMEITLLKVGFTKTSQTLTKNWNSPGTLKNLNNSWRTQRLMNKDSSRSETSLTHPHPCPRREEGISSCAASPEINHL